MHTVFSVPYIVYPLQNRYNRCLCCLTLFVEYFQQLLKHICIRCKTLSTRKKSHLHSSARTFFMQKISAHPMPFAFNNRCNHLTPIYSFIE